MLIDIENDAITINLLSSELKAHSINQIKYWGFVQEPHQNLYKLCSRDFKHLLPKLLRYFDKEKINYSLTTACQKYLSTIKEKLENFERIRCLGRE